jgi:hypothetical protein
VGAEVALAAWVPAFLADVGPVGAPGGRGAGCLWFFRRFVGPLGCFWAVLSRPFCSWSDPGVSWPRFWPVWGLCRSVVLLGPGSRSVCVAPFASGPSLCL